MHQSELTTLQQRLDTLERRQRRMRVLVLFIGAVGLAPYVIGAGSRGGTARIDVLRAERIDLVHGDTVFVSLTGVQGKKLHDQDSTGKALGIMSASGKLTSALIADGTGGNLYVYGTQEQVLATLNTDADGGALSISGINGQYAANIDVRPNAGGELLIRDLKGSLVGDVIARTDSGGGGGEIQVLDQHRMVVGDMKARTAEFGGGILEVRDRHATVIFDAFSRKDSAGGEMHVYNRQGKDVASVFSRSDGLGGEFDIRNMDGKRLASMFAGDTTSGTITIESLRGVDLVQLGNRSSLGGQITVRDQNDSVTAALMSRTDGQGGDLEIYAPNGKRLASVFAASDGGMMSINDRSGSVIGSMHMATGGRGGAIGIYGAGSTGHAMASMFARDDGTGADVQVFDGSGSRVAALFSAGSGGRLQLYDASGTLKHAVP